MATLTGLGQPVNQPQQPLPSVEKQTSVDQFEKGKIFVGGLDNKTTKETMQKHFGQYGETTEVEIMVDQGTGRSRGFGFVSFKEPSVVDEVLANKPHKIDGKIVDPKPAVQKGVDVAPTGLLIHGTKVFIGGVSQNTNKKDIEAYFLKFGKVVETDLKYDRFTNRMRGFGFVGFENEEAAKEAAKTPFHTINGKTVEVKAAEPRGKTPGGGGGAGRGGGYHPYPPPPPHPSVYDYSNYRQSNGMASYGPGVYNYPPHNYQFNAYPPPSGPPGHYTQQFNGQDYNSYSSYGRGQSSYGQDNGYNHRAGYSANTAEAYSGGTTYNSGGYDQTSQYAYSDPNPATSNYGRGTSQSRFTQGYTAR